MPSYKVTYFDLKGRAEPTRLALSAAGQTFEDVRLTNDEWAKLKPTLPSGQLPMLEVDGEVINQSGAMLRYVGRQFSLYGANNMESTKVDTVIESTEDLFKELVKIVFEPDADKKKTLDTAFWADILPRFVKIFGGFLDKNSKGGGWLVGSKMTIGDIVTWCMFDFVNDMLAKGDAKLMKCYTDHAKLKAHAAKVAAEPKIKAWLDKRPKPKPFP